MSIPEYLKEVKSYSQDIFIVLSIVLACTLGYGLGSIGQESGGGASVISSFRVSDQEKSSETQKTSESNTEGVVYASRNGTRYYYEHCSGLSRIKPANKISFPTRAMAEAKGLILASGCYPN